MPLFPCIRKSSDLRDAYVRFLENEVAKAQGRKARASLSVPVSIEDSSEPSSNYQVVAVISNEQASPLVLLMNTNGGRQFVVVDPFNDTHAYRVTPIDTKTMSGSNNLATIQRILKG